MKLFIKFLIFILVLGLAAPFILQRPDGRPLMEASDVVPSAPKISADLKRWWSNLGRSAKSIVGNDSDSDDSLLSFDQPKIYRWRDEYGNLMYSDQPHPQGLHEEVLVGKNANVVAGTALPDPDASNNNSAQGDDFTVPLPLSVSPEEASKLLKDARNVQKLMEDRGAALDTAIDGSH